MTKTATILAAAALLGLAACSKAPDATNVADTENSAGAALENSAAELDATTDNLVEGEVANIDAEANGAAVDTAAGNNATN
jgi:starvation-inducible outer membrane lipoprotein